MTSESGKWLRDARAELGLNIKSVSDILGAPYRTVQDWNAGRRTPPDWLQRLIVEKLEQAKR